MRLVGVFCLWCCVLCAWGNMPYTCMFYNVENYFDCEDDTLTNDDEFVPAQPKYWTPKRYTTKRQNIARVIVAVGKGTAPVLVGLCEVENAKVLHQLVRYKPLSVLNYQTVHFESPDARGIDVALLYQPTAFLPLQSKPIRVGFKDGTFSRDILYVKGLLGATDTLHVMVCHAPSRRSGATGDARRMDALKLVRAQADSLLAVQPSAKVLIMGDFNDTPTDNSMQQGLGAVVEGSTEADSVAKLYNLMDVADGTYKYKGQWCLFDQFVVSSSLLQGKGWVVKDKQAYVYKADFLLQPDVTYMGYKPYRTYLGPRYIGGYSDHLPIYLQFEPCR